MKFHANRTHTSSLGNVTLGILGRCFASDWSSQVAEKMGHTLVRSGPRECWTEIPDLH